MNYERNNTTIDCRAIFYVGDGSWIFDRRGLFVFDRLHHRKENQVPLNVGLMWLIDDPKSPLADGIIKAATRYTEKYGKVPNVCMLHPSMLPEKPLEIAGIAIRPYRSILPRSLWIGIEEKS